MKPYSRFGDEMARQSIDQGEVEVEVEVEEEEEEELKRNPAH
jgi:hypothetical protein